jgi:hypothetical protein
MDGVSGSIAEFGSDDGSAKLGAAHINADAIPKTACNALILSPPDPGSFTGLSDASARTIIRRIAEYVL